MADRQFKFDVVMNAQNVINGASALAAQFNKLSTNSNTSSTRLKELATAMERAGRAAKTERESLIKLAEAEERINKVRRESKAQTGLINARGDEVAARAAANTAVQAGREQLYLAKAQTEAVRQRVAVEQAAAANESRALRDQLALRKQAFNEAQQLLGRGRGGGGVGGFGLDDMTTGMSGFRYALHDVSSGLRNVGIAVTGVSTSVIAMGMESEKQFMNVVRTTGASAQEIIYLNAQMSNLASTLPVTYEALTQIATLAGQMGIPTAQVADFTKTVAMFSATTDVSVEDAATAFGRLTSVVDDVDGNFTGLAESILKVGVNSVATEGQIIRITTQISSVADQAGFTYQQIIGLSGALASIGVPPELARGVMTRTFGLIARSISNGGTSLEKFASAAGMSGAQFKQAWSDDAAGTFMQFMTRLNQAGGEGEMILRELGITSVRDVPILLRLAGAANSVGEELGGAGEHAGLLAQTMNDAANASGELQKQYSIISGTTGARLQVLLQSIQAALLTITNTQMGGLGDFFADLTMSVRQFADALDEPVRLFDMIELPMTNAELLGWATVAGMVVGVLALLLAGIGRVAAGVIASRQAWAAATTMLAPYTAAGRAAAAANMALASSTMAAAGATRAQVLAMERGTARSTGFGGALRGMAKGLGATALLLGGMELLKFAADSAKATTEVSKLTNQLLTAGDGFKSFSNIEVQKGGVFGLGAVSEAAFKDAQDIRDALSSIKDDGFWADFGYMTFGASENFHKVSAAADAFDESLSSMVAAGNFDAAIDSFSQLVNGAKLTDEQILSLMQRMEGFSLEINTELANRGLESTDKNIIKLVRGTMPEMQAAAARTAGVLDETLAAAFDGSGEAALAFLDTIDSALTGFIDFEGAYQDVLDGVNEKAKAEWVEQGNAISEFKDVAIADMNDYFAVIDQQIADQAAYSGNLAQIIMAAGPEYAAAAAKLPADIARQITEGMNAGNMEGFQKFLEQAEFTGDEATNLVKANIANATPEMVAEWEALGAGSADAFFDAISKGDRSVEQIMQDARDAAQAALDGDPLEIVLNANPGPARTVFDDTKSYGEAMEIWLKARGDAKPAREDFLLEKDYIAGLTYWLNTRAQTAPARSDFESAESYAEALQIWLKARADTKPVRSDFDTAKGYGDALKAWMSAYANTAEAERALNWAARNRTMHINTTWTDSGGNVRTGPVVADRAATGGYIRGPGSGTSDSIPIAVSNGEFVIRAASVDKYGVNFFHRLNQGVAKFATGGLVNAGSTGYQTSYASQQSSANRNVGSQMVELSPYDRRLLAAAGNTFVGISERTIAKANNRAVVRETNRGAY